MKVYWIIILLLFFHKGLSQTVNNQFVVLTFEVDRNKDMHGIYIYHWIISIDSINSTKDLELYPVYLYDFYSSDSFENCCKNDSIDFITLTTATKYNFTNEEYQQKEIILKLVKENRILVQQINKKWDKGYKEKVKVFATPITGEFCSCKIYGRSLNFTQGKHKVYLPDKNFKVIAQFWETPKANIIKYWDYAQMGYSNSEYRTSK